MCPRIGYQPILRLHRSLGDAGCKDIIAPLCPKRKG